MAKRKSGAFFSQRISIPVGYFFILLAAVCIYSVSITWIEFKYFEHAFAFQNYYQESASLSSGTFGQPSNIVAPSPVKKY